MASAHQDDYYEVLRSQILWRNYRRFIVLTRSRTGSNLLISMLNGHPEVRATGEIFRTLKNRFPGDVMKTVFSDHQKSIKAVGFKIFYYHPLDGDSHVIWNLLEDMDGLLVIHLKRKNILRTLISKKIASQTDEWQRSQDCNSPRDKRVVFTEDELRVGFRQTRTWEDHFGRLFDAESMLDIYYEELIQDREQAFGEITKHLGIRPFTPQTHLKKQNPEKASDLIVNFQELKRAFSRTEWAYFFDIES